MQSDIPPCEDLPLGSNTAPSLLKHLYRISLEDSMYWGVWYGVPSNTIKMDEQTIDMFEAYLKGLRTSERLRGNGQNDLENFLDWLAHTGHFRHEGWVRKFLRETDGDHLKAIGRFWSLMYEYLLENRPEWFAKLNSRPVCSQISRFEVPEGGSYGDADSVPIRDDIRIQSHIVT